MVDYEDMNQLCQISFLRAQRTLNVHPSPFAWAIFPEDLFADSDRVFGRFGWVDLGRVGLGDRSHDYSGDYNSVKSDMDIIIIICITIIYKLDG